MVMELKICLMWMVVRFLSVVESLPPDAYEAKLMDDLLVKERYNKNARPIKGDPKEQMIVQFWMIVKRVENLNEKDQTMTTFGWLDLNWRDEFLSWDPADYGGLDRIVLPAHDIWLPEVSMFNSVDQGNDLSFVANYRATVFHTGWANFAPGFKWTTSCPVNLKYFPYDTQVCNVTFVNWVYTGNYLNFTLALNQTEVDTTFYDENKEWELISTRVMRGDLYPDPGLPMPHITFELTLKRRPEFLVMNIMIPATMMSLLSALVFCLPAESGEKVGLGITVLLSFSVILLMITDITPRIGQPMPIMTTFVVVNMVLTAFSLSGTVLVLAVYHYDPQKPVPKWLRKSMLGYLARALCVNTDNTSGQLKMNVKIEPQIEQQRTSPAVDLDMDDKKRMNGLSSGLTLSPAAEEYFRLKIKVMEEVKELEKNKVAWHKLSAVLDRLLFILFMVVAGITGATITGVIMN